MAKGRGRFVDGAGQSLEGVERRLVGQGEEREEVWLSGDIDEREDTEGLQLVDRG